VNWSITGSDDVCRQWVASRRSVFFLELPLATKMPILGTEDIE
jgi:hypothetical protein